MHVKDFKARFDIDQDNHQLPLNALELADRLPGRKGPLILHAENRIHDRQKVPLSNAGSRSALPNLYMKGSKEVTQWTLISQARSTSIGHFDAVFATFLICALGHKTVFSQDNLTSEDWQVLKFGDSRAFKEPWARFDTPPGTIWYSSYQPLHIS